jgi:hypothetical protein
MFVVIAAVEYWWHVQNPRSEAPGNEGYAKISNTFEMKDMWKGPETL